MRISLTSRGDFKRTDQFLKKLAKGDLYRNLDSLAKRGQAALASATPVNTALASMSWGYEIEIGRRQSKIVWTNSDIENGFPVVVMLQYGYATGTGGYVRGRDFINPAIQPVMDDIAEKVWKEVKSA